MLDKGVLRVIDANFNRCKEGLRVVEDIFRFILPNQALRKKIRKLRHSLTAVAKKKILKQAILCRDSSQDPGRDIDSLEIKRKDVESILYANLQRAKESLRVLEEFLKLDSKLQVSAIKKIRYDVYELEKEILRLRPALCNPRSQRNQRGKT